MRFIFYFSRNHLLRTKIYEDKIDVFRRILIMGKEAFRMLKIKHSVNSRKISSELNVVKRQCPTQSFKYIISPTLIKEIVYLIECMSEGDDISEDDLHEALILRRFQQISELMSSIDFKNRNEAQSTYQSLRIAILIMRDLLMNMHGITNDDLDNLEERARIIFDRNTEQLRTKGLRTI